MEEKQPGKKFLKSGWVVDTQPKHKKPRKVGCFRVYMADSPSVPLTSTSSTNQTPLRRSRHNRRNRTNRGQRVTQFESKTSYKFKKLPCGLLIFGKRQLFDRRRASGGQGNQTSKEGSNFRTESQNYTVSPQDNQFVGS